MTQWGMGYLPLAAAVLACGSDKAASELKPSNNENTTYSASSTTVSITTNNGSATSAGGSGGGMSGTADAISSTTGNGDPYAPTFSNGACRPKGPMLEEVSGARLIRSMDGIDDLNGIALHNDALYFNISREGTLRLRPPTADGASAEMVVPDTTVWDLVASDSHIYYVQTNNRELWRAALDTLPATPELVMENVSETEIFTDGENLYFSRSSGSGILTIPLAELAPGAEATLLVEDTARLPMTVADGFLYYIDYQTINRVPITGGAPEVVFSIGAPRDLDVDEGVIYFVSDVRITKQDLTTLGDGMDFVTLAVGNKIFEGSEFDQELAEIRVEGDKVYYREENGALAWVLKDGSDCRIVAEMPTSLSPRTLEWEMSATHYYVNYNEEELWEIPR